MKDCFRCSRKMILPSNTLRRLFVPVCARRQAQPTCPRNGYLPPLRGQKLAIPVSSVLTYPSADPILQSSIEAMPLVAHNEMLLKRLSFTYIFFSSTAILLTRSRSLLLAVTSSNFMGFTNDGLSCHMTTA